MIGPIAILIAALLILLCTRSRLAFNLDVWDFKNSKKARELRRQEMNSRKNDDRMEKEDARVRAELEGHGVDGMNII